MTNDPYAALKADDPVHTNLDAVLISLADELQAAEDLVAQKERELQDAKDALRDITDIRIPQVTDGLEGKFNLSDGRVMTVKEDLRSSIAGEKRVPAIKWLDDHGYGKIIKRELVFQFPKGDEAAYKDFLNGIRNMKIKGSMKEQFSVHHATLNAWVKEQMSEGVDLPRETFGIFRQRVAKVKE